MKTLCSCHSSAEVVPSPNYTTAWAVSTKTRSWRPSPSKSAAASGTPATLRSGSQGWVSKSGWGWTQVKRESPAKTEGVPVRPR